MALRRICAAAAGVAAVVALAGPATAGPRHWFYDSYGAYDRGAVVDFGFWAGPRAWWPGYYGPPRPRRYAAYPPLYPGERPARPGLYYEVAPGEYVPAYGDRASGRGGSSRPASVAPQVKPRPQLSYVPRPVPIEPRVKPQPMLTYVPRPRPKPPVPQKLAVIAPAPAIVETDAPDGKVSGAPMSCDKARQIVSGFGFSDIQALTCKGEEYGFTAKRDGDAFDIRLSSLTGKLIRVKRR